ncbi:MAG: DUF1080 domain-containing protein [Verrucomicrobiales bacterium]|nr:DUF1080 domain-containing protein [Verrucomicrobiales bacterium]
MKKLLPYLTLLSAGIFLSACSEPTETASEAPAESAEASEAAEAQDDGWVSLFDGETLNGWKPSTLGSAEYSVVDGTIYGKTVEGSPNTFLLSEEQYGDFELEFEVKVHDSLNSGCQIRSREKNEADLAISGKDGKPATDLNRFWGPQVELESSPGQSAYIYGEATGRGWISPEPADKEHSHDYMKNGEWNQIRIVAKGPNIKTFINGNAVADLTDGGIYETHPKGHIGLQVHGIKKGTGPFDVAWKNIRIKTL